MMLIISGFAVSAVAQTSPVRFVDTPGDSKLIAQVRNLARLGPDSVSEVLSRNGYLDHAITKKGDSLLVETGRLYRIGTVNLSLVPSEGDTRELTMSGYLGRVASQSEIDRIRKHIIDEYYSRGNYFAALHTDRVELRDGTLDLYLRLIAGPPVIIERLRFRGLTKSKPSFVAALSGLREGDLLISEDISNAVRKIEAEGYLQSDSTPLLTPNREYTGVELLFHITERKSNRLELGGGYLPGHGDLDGEFVGRFDFESKNLFGHGRKLILKFDRKDRSSSRTEFRFVQPLFIPDHLELSAHFVQVDYDSSYHSFTAEGGVSLITRGGLRLSGAASWNKTEPQRLSQPPSRTVAGRFSIDYDRRDYSPNPSGGRRVQLGAAYLRRSSWPQSSTTTVTDNESVFELAADNYVPLPGPIMVRVNAEARARITSRDLIDFSEQFKLGGYGSLRGYREDEFAGRRTGLGQAEIRVRPSRQFAVYLFADVGYVYSRRETSPGRVESEEIVRGGSGLGLFVGNATVRMALEIGWGRHDGIDDGKIHMGISTLF